MRRSKRAAVVAVLGLAWGAAATEIPWDERASRLVPEATAAVAADLDGDGDLDIVAASETDDAVRLSFNLDGAGVFFSAMQEIATVAAPADLAVGDLDGDGDLDAVAASFELSGALVWLENDGSPGSGLWPTHSIASSVTPVAVALADLDGDGDLDVLAASVFDDGIAWYENDGAAVPAFAVQWVTRDTDGLGGAEGDCDAAADVAAADVDRDGDLDLVTACHDNDRVAWHENLDGAGGFGAQQVLDSSLDGARHVLAADLDRDADFDVLASGALDGRVTRYLQGASGFAAAELVDVHTGAATLDVADPDEDGDVDVLMGHADGVRWREHVGDLGFRSLAVDLVAGGGPRAASWADLDGDGDLDVLVARYDGGTVGWYENRTIHDSAAFPALPTLPASRGDLDVLASGDVDGDGDLDLLAASWLLAPEDPQGTFLLWNENTGGGFAGQERLADIFDRAQDLALGDLDGDGDLDALVSTSGILGAVLEWWENDGAANFADDHRIAGAEVWPDVEIVDVDRDGDLDVMAAQSDFVAVVWFENTDGAGTFAAPQTVWERQDGHSGAVSIAVADFDRDGDADVAATATVGPIVWLAADGGGGFGAPQVVHTPETNGAVRLAAADLDGDGWPDLVAHTNARGVHWLRNLHDGSFAAAVDLGGFDGSQISTALVPLDLDGDGDLDLALADRVGGRVGWLENLGGAGPAFAFHLLLDDDSSVRALAAGDLDGDGDLDLAFGAHGTLELGWWPNRGGQYSLAPVATAQELRLPAAVHDLFRLDLRHLGRDGDEPLDMLLHVLLVETAPGVAASAGEIQSAFADFGLWRDDGDGTFDAGADLPIPTTWEVVGVETRLTTDATFATGTAARLWVTGETLSGGPSQLRLTYRGARTRFEHPGTSILLDPVPIADAGTGWMTFDAGTSCRAPHELELDDVEFQAGTWSCRAGTDLHAETVVLHAGAEMTFTGGRSVILSDGFRVQSGASLEVRIDPALLPE